MTTSYHNYASTPQHVAVDFYRGKSSWSLLAELCPCDLEFAEYFKIFQVIQHAVELLVMDDLSFFAHINLFD